MQFGVWIPLEALLGEGQGTTASAAVDQLPRAAGVFQLRVAHGLLSYPRGKSAMVAYGGGDDVVAALRALLGEPAGQRALQHAPLLVRFAEPDPHSTALQHLERLRERFCAQFGSLPLAEVTAKESR